jgi:hypothetical protein
MPRFHPLIYGLLLTWLLAACGPQPPETLFSALPGSRTGIKFANRLTESEGFNVLKYGYFYNGGGVAIGDLDNDGLNDIYFSGNMVGNRLYRNKGDLSFEDVTERAGVAAMVGWKTGVTLADVNADGRLDVYVCRSGSSVPAERENLLYINQGGMRFSEQAAAYGLNDPGYSTQAAFFDHDRDGDLDLWLVNHSVQEYAGLSQISAAWKKQQSPLYGNKFYRNDGGHFTDVTGPAGLVANMLSFGLGIGVSDFNDDGWPDVYISNDYNEQDYLYLNHRDGTFRERLAECIGHTSLFSMGLDVADVNNDGRMDLLTLDMLPEDNLRQKQVMGSDNYDKYQLLVRSGFYHQTMRNMLQLNNGPVRGADSARGNPVPPVAFSEIGQLAGVSNTDWSWAALFADFNRDGRQDLFVSNGYARDYTNMDFLYFAAEARTKERQGSPQLPAGQVIEKMPAAPVPNYVFENTGGLAFAKRTAEWGLGGAGLSNGAACGDLDNDGDLDLVVNNLNAAAAVYRNNGEVHTKGNGFLKVRLAGAKRNKNGIGAKVQVVCTDQTLTQEMMLSRGFQSAVPPELVFGLGRAAIRGVRVTWPSGKVQTVAGVAPNQTLTLQEEDGTVLPPPPAGTAPAFTPVPSLLSFTHREDSCVDFKVQRLLPNALSTQGPRAVKGDVDGDGWDDLFVGGARGQAGTLFVQTASGTFREVPQADLARDAPAEDTDAAFLDVEGDGDLDLCVVGGGYCFDAGDAALQPRLYLNDGKGKFSRTRDGLPAFLVNASCVKAGDVDGDRDPDLFVGGRVIPGRYPVAPESYLLVNDGKGRFQIATDRLAPQLKRAGLVTDAAWCDLNGDQLQDLVVVGEWMPVRFLINQRGRLVDQTAALLPEPSAGWWNRIVAEDFDADGDLDLVVGNLGLNAQVKASPAQPASLLYGDFDGNGSVDPVLCHYLGGKNVPAFSRDELTGQLVFLKKRFPNYKSYAEATVEEVFTAPERRGARRLEANRFQTSYLENRGGTFAFRALPVEAQFAPVYAIGAMDLNGDGHRDLLLGGNLEKTRVFNGKYDANYGVALLGDGKGHFTYLPQTQSGLSLRGDVRDVTVLAGKAGPRVVFWVNNGKTVTYALTEAAKGALPRGE